MTCNFTSFLTVFQSYQKDGRVIMKGSCAIEPHLCLNSFVPDMGSNLRPLDQQASS